MAKRKTTVDTILLRKLKIRQHESHKEKRAWMQVLHQDNQFLFH
jgi:hypothetical protein